MDHKNASNKICDAGITIVIPAYNEEKYLPQSLSAIREAKKFLQSSQDADVEVIVVNNDSTDKTSEVAIENGVSVIHHTVRNIASVRNAGIHKAKFDIIITLDADSILPEHTLLEVWKTMQDPEIIGASLGVEFTTDKIFLKVLAFLIQKFVFFISGVEGGMVCFRKTVVLSFGGFPEHRYVAEDVSFGRLMRKYAKYHHKKFLDRRDIRITSPDRKKIRLRDFLQIFYYEIKTFFGHNPKADNFNYWYKPDR